MVYKKNLVKGRKYVEFYKSKDLRILEFIKIDKLPERYIGRVPLFNIIVGKREGKITSPRLNFLYEIDSTWRHQLVEIIFHKDFVLM